MTLVLTHECNLACSYCYTGEKFRREMDWETASARSTCSSTPRRAVPPRVEAPIDLGFFGGEPLSSAST
ncbi:MAG: 4Fe-4S cluster-binding domain-containing protein [Deltaproteobacteria bacterium]|nr:4Fe-4S cluster-binding domain-containing protein [Deltaproteobacteria bacterium]